jgi:imidazole glycerol phosphate synthase glutamine amidotransferase subunit
MAQRIAIVDSGGANIASLLYALRRLQTEAILTTDADTIKSAERVILPGVGAAKDAMQRLRENDLVDVIRELTQPVLGICLGMQLLADASEEEDVDCLGIIPGVAAKLPADSNYPVPNMGWCPINKRCNHELLEGVDSTQLCATVIGIYAGGCSPCSAIFSGCRSRQLYCHSVSSRTILGRRFPFTGKLFEAAGMKIIPAIDLQGGKCVRLFQGDFAQATEYSSNPVEIARQFASLSTTDLHLVDLDGARSGTQENRSIVKSIAGESSLSIQLGGGIRSLEVLSKWFDCGVARCVIGSLAITEPEEVMSWIARFGAERIVLCWHWTSISMVEALRL